MISVQVFEFRSMRLFNAACSYETSSLFLAPNQTRVGMFFFGFSGRNGRDASVFGAKEAFLVLMTDDGSFIPTYRSSIPFVI